MCPIRRDTGWRSLFQMSKSTLLFDTECSRQLRQLVLEASICGLFQYAREGSRGSQGAGAGYPVHPVHPAVFAPVPVASRSLACCESLTS